MKYLISGSVAYDRIMDFPGKFSDHILPHKIHQINVSFGLSTLNVNYGGTAGNIAYNLALLGEKPYIISQVGNDFKEYQTWLLKHKINLSCVRKITGTTCPTAHIITDQSDNQITGFYFGAMQWPATQDKQIVQKLKRVSATIGLIAAGNVDDMIYLAKIYKQQHVKYIFDPGQQTIWLTSVQLKAILNGAHGLIVNDYELALIQKKLNVSLAKLIKQLPYLIVTLGEKGAMWYVSGKKFNLPVAKPNKVLDPTGAGDAYRAGVLLGLTRNWDIQTTGQVSALCATYAIEHYGTQQQAYSVNQFKKRYYQVFRKKLII